jgi:hypothetical protein
MSTLADGINNQVRAGRRTIQRSIIDLQKQSPINRVPRRALVATGVAAAICAVGLCGWMVYRSRRQRTLIQRLRDAIPDSVKELPTEARHRAKGPLERAVKAL